MSVISGVYNWRSQWWIVVLVIFIFIFYQRLGTISLDKAAAIGIALLWFAIFAKLIPDYFKVRSPKLITNPQYDTTTGDKITCGDFVAYRKGGVRIKPINIEGRSGTFFVLNNGDNTLGNNRILSPKCEKVSLAELPPDAIRAVKEHDLPEPYWLGLAHEEDYEKTQPDSETNKPVTVGSRVSLIRIENAINRMNQCILRNDPEPIKQTLKMIKEIQGSAEPESSTRSGLRKIFLSD